MGLLRLENNLESKLLELLRRAALPTCQVGWRQRAFARELKLVSNADDGFRRVLLSVVMKDIRPGRFETIVLKKLFCPHLVALLHRIEHCVL